MKKWVVLVHRQTGARLDGWVCPGIYPTSTSTYLLKVVDYGEFLA